MCACILTDIGLMKTRHRPTKGRCEKAMALTAASNLSGCSCFHSVASASRHDDGLHSAVHLEGSKDLIVKTIYIILLVLRISIGIWRGENVNDDHAFPARQEEPCEERNKV